MANFNKIMLLGNLTRDPQLSYLPSNTPVVELGLAVNRRYRRQDGEQAEETLFVDCRAYARSAEVLNQYCRKGSQLFVEGRLQLDRWTDKEGNPRSKHRVFIENFQFIGSREGSGGSGSGGRNENAGSNPSNNAGSNPSNNAGSNPSNNAGSNPSNSSLPGTGIENDPISSDDIPF